MLIKPPRNLSLKVFMSPGVDKRSARDFEKMSVQEVYAALSSSEKGLSSEEVSSRLKKYGFNEVPGKKKNPLVDYLRRFWGPLPWLMEITIITSVAAGKILEAEIIAFLLVLNATIGFLHSRSSERAVELLKKKLSVRVSALRDGEWREVDARELVPGDIIFLRLGSIVPADAKIISGNLLVDQSALTGESLPVEVGPGGIIFSGSIAKRGEARCIVVATGTRTYFGKTIELVREAKTTSMQEEAVLKITRYMLYAGLAALAISVPVALMEKWSLLSLIDLAVVFLMSSVPVALPAVLTIMQAYGSMELSRKNVLVTRLSAVEDIGAVNVACLDKTGTITLNQLKVVGVKGYGFSEKEVVLFAVLASREEAHDPLNDAIVMHGKEIGVSRSQCKELSFTPFEPSLKRSECVAICGDEKIRALLGEPKTILSLCTNSATLEKVVLSDIDEASKRGARTLAVAVQRGDSPEITFAGLIHLMDPPRPDAKEMILRLRENNVRPIMLTGDNVSIAREVARSVSIGERIFSVREIESMGMKLEDVVENADGLAEVYPEDKFYVVKALQARNYRVAMTGDGVNDAPALSQAEAGIAVKRATDAAKAAASLVLLEDGLPVIVDAIIVGRILHQRALTWVINKITKTLQTILVVLVGMIWLRKMSITPLGMAVLLLANDFLTISISTDNAKPSKKPASWNVKSILKLSLPLSIAMAIPPILVLHFAASILKLTWSATTSAVLLSLIYSSQVRLLMVRERDWFWSSKPGRELAITVAGTLVVFTVLAISGIIFTGLNLMLISLVFLASLIPLSFEPLKVYLARKHF
jgi:H+-transporting ATPase